MEQGVRDTNINITNGLRIGNELRQGVNYYLAKNEHDAVVVREAPPQIQNLKDLERGKKYHLTEANGNIFAYLDNSLQLTQSNFSENLIFGIRKEGDSYFITRVPSLLEFVFETEDLQVENSFSNHVCTLSGKLVKIGFVHVIRADGTGLIDRDYEFFLLVNDLIPIRIRISKDDGIGSNRSRTIDTENLNIFFNSGDFIRLFYSVVVGGSSKTGNYCQVKLIVDTNARNSNFGELNLP